MVAFFLVAAVAPGLLTGRDPLAIDLAGSLQPPSWSHPLGTDESGRDLFARVVHGTRQSLLIGLGATALGDGPGRRARGRRRARARLVDAGLDRLVEVLFAFPVLLLALLFVAVFGISATTQIVAVGIGSAPGYARMVRGQVLAAKGSPYVEAAHALGHPYGRVVRQHILPNAMRPLVALVTLGVGQSIVWASSLAFLGLGVAAALAGVGRPARRRPRLRHPGLVARGRARAW